MKIDYALVSVSNKEGVVELGRELHALEINILSTGGTAKTLEAAGIPVIRVSQHTGFPEILGGRVKTLHPRIHAGILARFNDPEHLRVLKENEIPPIPLVVVNLYPFQQTVAREGTTYAEAIEQIDIGGPSMIRAAAKNHENVTVVVDPSDYPALVEELKARHGEISWPTRLPLARKAFAHTAAYDAAIAEYLNRVLAQEMELPLSIGLDLVQKQVLRYGENPHQRGGLFSQRHAPGKGLAGALQRHGKTLSFNNYLDLEAAWRLAWEFSDPFCGIIKHTNPCGAATAATLAEAYARAYECDPVSAFGSVIGFNHPVDRATADALGSLFIEAVIAPGYEPGALELLTEKKNLRIMEMDFRAAAEDYMDMDFKKISGGFVVQDRDSHRISREQLKTVTQRAPSEEEMDELLFAWRVCKHVKSNAIVYAKGGQIRGVGAGQMSRVDSVRLGAQKAQLSLDNCVVASDAFFPFRDGIDEAARNGARAIIQPGGSLRDEEGIKAADEHGMAMVFTGIRHFKH
jgi:phosphoribosylaminoimidazolecarboxamide formyltransferase / IMP cyclohydrolase